MMSWLIFFFYFFLFSWLITRIGFIKRSGLSNRLLVTLFAVKVIAGIAYLQFHSQPQYKYRSDTIKFYEQSLPQTALLKSNPVAFFREIFVSGYETSGNLFSDSGSYWNDVKDTMMIKTVAITNLFTFNNYYADTIFFSFIFFIGLIAFFRLMDEIFPGRKKLLVAAIFFIPSFLFWCSGIHKDGLIFSCLAFTLYGFHSLLQKRRIASGILIILPCLLMMFFLRNYLVMVLLAAIFAGWLVHHFPKRKWLVLLVCFISGAVLFFNAKYIHPSLDLPYYVVSKQQQFKKLEGNSLVDVNSLEPSAKSFLTNLPSAIDMAFFRPHVSEKGIVSIMASAEMILFWLIIITCIIYRNKSLAFPPVIITCLIFAILTLLVIGYTVPFSGAVVRYRSLVMPLLLAPFLAILSPGINITKKYM